jgi:hypothetical protein
VKIIESYDIFANDYEKLGSLTVGVHTITTDNAKPIYVPPYRKSYKEREEIKEEVNKMLEAGIIQHSRSPLLFPVVQVPKKNGTRRFYKRRNSDSSKVFKFGFQYTYICNFLFEKFKSFITYIAFVMKLFGII